MSTSTNKHHLRVRALCEGAIFVAIAQVLSYLKLFGDMVNGGSITFAAFPIILYALRWGVGKGLIASFAFGLLQMFFDGAYAWGWQSMILDYIVAYTPLGLAGLFKGKAWGIFPGAVLGNSLRFVVHFISGVTIYAEYVSPIFGWEGSSATIYSILYNGSYMLPNTLIAVIAIALLQKPLRAFLEGKK